MNVPVVGTVNRRWVFIGAATVAVIVLYAYHRRARKTPVTYDPSQGGVDLGTGGYQNPAPTSPRSGPVDEGQEADDNETWSRKAVEALIGAGYNAQYAAIVIGKYLASVPLSEEELNTVRAAFALVGYPPDYIAPIPLPTTGTPPPTQPPPTQPPPIQPPPSGPATISVGAGTDMYQFSHQYFPPADHQSFARMEALNPTVRSNLYWEQRPGNVYGNLPRLRTTMTIRLR